MTITLTSEQIAWIDARVARGEFLSQEDAARRLLDAAILDQTMIEDDDLRWARPLVEEALLQVEQGEVVTLEEHLTRNAARIAVMKP